MNTALILAAGRGDRLKPLTDLYPKPLCVLHGKPLIEYHIIRLARAGFTNIIINHAYLGGKIRQYLQNGAHFGVNIVYSPEPPGALETGGGIVNALSLLGKEPFITVNSDIYTNYDFSLLQHKKNSLAHLVLVHTPADKKIGDFGLTKTQHIDNEDREFTFSGIAYYHPDFFKQCKPGRYSVTPLLRQMASLNSVTGEIHPGIWFDIGTLERLQQAEKVITPQLAELL